MRGSVEQTTVAVLVYAEVQENGDGTWTAIAYPGGVPTRCASGETREEALGKAAELASVDLTPDCPQ